LGLGPGCGVGGAAAGVQLENLVSNETDTAYTRFRPLLILQWIMNLLTIAAKEGRLRESRCAACAALEMG